MARLSRLSVPGLPHLLEWRGHNGQPVFVDTEDRQRFLTLLAEGVGRESVQLHAYALLDSAVLLLLTPAVEGAVARLVQGIGRSYVRVFNRRHGRTGTLWDGRYRCTVLEPRGCVVPAMVLVDTAPVRAGLCASPGAYAWSSCAHTTGHRAERMVTPHPELWALGNTPFAREAAYAERVEQGLSAAEQARLENAMRHGWALGSPGFLAELQERLQRRVVKGRPGRPRGTPRDPGT